MKLIVFLSIFVFAFSMLWLIKCRYQCGKLGFLYLFVLHLIIGIGYIYLALYEIFELGPLYPTFRIGPSSEMAFLYVLFISLSLLLLNFIWVAFDKKRQHFQEVKYRFWGPEFFLVVPLLLLIYLAGLQFKTLGVGLEKFYVLPFRLNGVIECVTLFLIPFYLAILCKSSKSFILLGMFILFYGVFNLISFGSKYAALYPIFVFFSVRFIISRLSLRPLILMLVPVLVLYTFLNPWYFRSILKEGFEISFIDTVVESFQQALQEPINLLISLRNIGHRITGFEAMECAIQLTNMDPSPKPQAIKYLNNFFMLEETSLAPGHFGYFMLATGDHFFGLLIGVGLLFTYLLVSIHFDRIYQRCGDIRSMLIGVTVLLNLFPFLIDGLYEHESPYFHMVFNTVVIYLWLYKKRWIKSQIVRKPANLTKL